MSRLSSSAMDARVTLWLSASFFIILNLLLTGGTENACTRTANETTIVGIDEPSANLLCLSFTNVWRKGSDLCDHTGFTRYNCNPPFSCTVNRSDYISEPATYFCCGSEETVDKYCYHIKINPILKVTVPPLLRAGREETFFVVVTAKPRPSVFPTLSVIHVIPDSNNNTNGTSDMRLTVSRRVATRPEEPLKYFVFYTFELPRIEQESAHAVLRITLPSDDTWRAYNNSESDNLAYPEVNIIPAPPVETTTAPPPEPTTNSEVVQTSSAQTRGPTTKGDMTRPPSTFGVRPACMDNELVAGIAVGSAIAAASFTVIAVVVVIYLCKKWRCKKRHEDKSHRPAPNVLPLDSSIPNGIIIEPTPTTDEAILILSESGRRTATSPLVSSEPNFTRLQSRGSNSPTTPMTEFDPLISHRHPGVIVHNESSSCAAAASSGPMRRPVEGENSGDDPQHVYSEIKNVLPLPPSKRPLPQTPPPFLCLRGQPAPCSGIPHTLHVTTQNFVQSPPGSDEDQMEPTYSKEGVKVNLEPGLLSPESKV